MYTSTEERGKRDMFEIICVVAIILTALIFIG